MCGLKEYGRDRSYFDFKRQISVDKYKLAIALGYKASIEIYKNKLLLCSEITHRLINQLTVLDFIKSAQDRIGSHGLKELCMNEIIGQSVMTKSVEIIILFLNFKYTKTFFILVIITKHIKSMILNGI